MTGLPSHFQGHGSIDVLHRDVTGPRSGQIAIGAPKLIQVSVQITFSGAHLLKIELILPVLGGTDQEGGLVKLRSQFLRLNQSCGGGVFRNDCLPMRVWVNRSLIVFRLLRIPNSIRNVLGRAIARSLLDVHHMNSLEEGTR